MNNTDFWTRVETVNAGMLETDSGARFVPMSHQSQPEAQTLWFITAKDTTMFEDLAEGPKSCSYVIADGGKGMYAHLTGRLSVSQDRDRLEALWSTVAESWFDGGIDDPNVRLLSYVVDSGEVWVTPTSGLSFLFSIAKANLTGEKPDMGDHFFL